jgi:flagellar hook assembly protein FlgD
MTDLPTRFQAAERQRRLDQELRSVGLSGGDVGVSDGSVDVEVDDVVRIRIGLLPEDSVVGIRFYDQDGIAVRTITEGSG